MCGASDVGQAMCGIAGIYSQSGAPVQRDELATMLATMPHRGPDASGVWLDDGSVGLAHVRLAVIDPSPAGNQPFESADGDLVLTYNGAIYNYVELREQLQTLGHRFRTGSDTEVLLAAYRQWGREVCGRLNGMWAFAIYDRRTDELFCSRDRFGIKPFYYAVVGGRLLFASEAKALLAVCRQLARINPEAVSKLMRASLAAHLSEHFCLGVRRLPAAHNMVVARGGTAAVKRYWSYPTRIDHGISFEGARERFRELLVDSIRLRMRSDVPVGTLLSGGLDSSAIVCLLRTFHGAEHDAFTARFDSSEYDESASAGRVAKQLGLRHHRIESPPGLFLPTLERIVQHMDGPSATPAVLPLWHIMAAMRDRVVVALDGQGADELLGGYHHFFAPPAIVDAVCARRWAQAFQHVRWLARNAGALRGSMYVAQSLAPWAHASWRRLRGDEAVYDGCLRGGPDAQPDRKGDLRHDEALADALRRRHEGGLQTLLHYGDAISMAHSIEARLPFMDYRLVEFVFRLPGEFKVRSGNGKALLRESVRGSVPDAIVDSSRKRGFPVPIREWFREQPEETVYPVLLTDRCRRRGLLDPTALRRALHRHRSGRVDLSNQIFRWITLEMWCQQVLD